MDHPMIANNIAHEHKDAEDVNEDHASDAHDTADNKESNKKNDDQSWDDCSKVDLTMIFQNTDDKNPIEFVYIRDNTGRVVSVDCCLKVPRNKVQFLRTYDEIGGVVDVECRFKKTGEDDDTIDLNDAK